MGKIDESGTYLRKSPPFCGFEDKSAASAQVQSVKLLQKQGSSVDKGETCSV
jgi:hypothetical protein